MRYAGAAKCGHFSVPPPPSHPTWQSPPPPSPKATPLDIPGTTTLVGHRRLAWRHRRCRRPPRSGGRRYFRRTVCRRPHCLPSCAPRLEPILYWRFLFVIEEMARDGLAANCVQMYVAAPPSLARRGEWMPRATGVCHASHACPWHTLTPPLWFARVLSSQGGPRPNKDGIDTADEEIESELPLVKHPTRSASPSTSAANWGFSAPYIRTKPPSLPSPRLWSLTVFPHD